MPSPRTGEQREVSTMRATAHPLRLRILSLLTGAEMSAAEVARELDVTHANASYHLRLLADAGLIVEAGEEKIRGGVAKRYRHPWQDASVEKGTPEEAAAFLRVVTADLARRYERRASGQRHILTDAEMWVAPEVWEQVQALVEQAATLIHAEAQRPRTPGTVHVNLTAVTFRMDDPAFTLEDKP
jgi:DNA-binding transcriptional ArsR family regulator